MNTDNRAAIMISSCDAYSDAWEPFFTLFFRYWPECPFPVYLISNSKKYPDERVRPILMSPDLGWASNLKKALELNSYPVVLYMQEDYFLKKPVDNELVKSLLETFINEQAAYLRLYPSPAPDKPYKNYKNIGELGKNANYRTSLQEAFWNSAVLKNLLKDGERGSEMEMAGNERSKKVGLPFLSVKKPALDYFATGIVKGEWNGGVQRFFKKQNLEVDMSKRLMQSRANAAMYWLRSLPVVGNLFRLIFRINYKLKSLFSSEKK